MAKKVTVDLVDDLDGSTDGVRTVEFAFEGSKYEIDLNREHYYEFKDKLAEYIEKGRSAGRSRPVIKPRPPSSRERSKRIRSWAAVRGIPVEARGRIPAGVIAQFEAEERNQK